MPHFEVVEYIERTPEEVFDFMTDAENATKIRPAIRGVKLLESGPQGRVKRFEVSRQQGGHEVGSEVSVLHRERPLRYTLATEREGLKLIYDYSLERESTGTKITLKAEVQAEGAKRVLAWLVTLLLESQDADLLRALEMAMDRQLEEESTSRD